MSPELIAPQQFGSKDSRPTKTSDCYALGMVIYETISGNLPFHEHTDLAVIVKVLEGERPPRGARFAKSLWKMLELCWSSRPNNRPSIEDVLQCLELVSNSSEPPSPEMDEETEDCDEWDSANGFPGARYDSDADADSHSSSFNYGAYSDMNWATGTTNVAPISFPTSPSVAPRHVRDKPTLNYQTHIKAPIRISSEGLPPGVVAVASENSGSETASTRYPTRKIVTSKRLATRRTRKIASANGPVPGSSNLSEGTTYSNLGLGRGTDEKTIAPVTESRLPDNGHPTLEESRRTTPVSRVRSTMPIRPTRVVTVVRGPTHRIPGQPSSLI